MPGSCSAPYSHALLPSMPVAGKSQSDKALAVRAAVRLLWRCPGSAAFMPCAACMRATLLLLVRRPGIKTHQRPSCACREMLERSTAAQCPSVPYQLAGAKKVQQDLAGPGVVERFVEGQQEAQLIRACFAGPHTRLPPHLCPAADIGVFAGLCLQY